MAVGQILCKGSNANTMEGSARKSGLTETYEQEYEEVVSSLGYLL